MLSLLQGSHLGASPLPPHTRQSGQARACSGPHGSSPRKPRPPPAIRALVGPESGSPASGTKCSPAHREAFQAMLGQLAPGGTQADLALTFPLGLGFRVCRINVITPTSHGRLPGFIVMPSEKRVASGFRRGGPTSWLLCSGLPLLSAGLESVHTPTQSCLSLA